MNLIKKTILPFILLVVSISYAQTEPIKVSKKPFTIGESLTFYSETLGEERTLNVYLPHSFSEEKEYPVIYLLDGSADEDFIHIAGLVQFGSFSWINMIPETIVVGVANVSRNRDYTYPSTDKAYVKKYPETGHSEKFIEFIEKELQPLVEKQYPVTSEKILIGQSLGGLLATEILFKKPDLFKNYIIVSPSLWYDYESLLKKEPKPYDTEKSIYVAVGEEGSVMKRVAKQLYKKLQKNKKGNTSLYYHFLEKQDHGDALHLAVYDAFEKLFASEKKK
ncbi:alpha/beta hydrolase [Marixanthomonas spongiae]|uniref:Esterase n=1 Tax=Marixanthomonas spongiae TaxID=2174845 RepID=A0A2U0I7J1_9FLAO|nr:alpha/beta hydrolase-fold protein [Marixanthomonas spongiae]PVW17010.1 esterase [Marixanthomonas spongiae]